MREYLWGKIEDRDLTELSFLLFSLFKIQRFFCKKNQENKH
jgi:hypothetical protein